MVTRRSHDRSTRPRDENLTVGSGCYCPMLCDVILNWANRVMAVASTSATARSWRLPAFSRATLQTYEPSSPTLLRLLLSSHESTR